MTNFELYRKWIERYAEREKKEAEEERKAKEAQLNKPKPEETSSKIEIPELKNALFLGGDWGKQIHEKVMLKYGQFKSISRVIYDDKDKIVKGSNPFYATAVNEVLREQNPNMRTATQADLEKILRTNALQLEGNYEDSALVLRSKEGPNKYLANNLYKQFEQLGMPLKNKTPYVIPLFTLKLREDEKSEHKLAFELTDLSLQNYFEAKILTSKNGGYINPNKMDEKIGLPTKVYTKSISGNRQLWTTNSGIVRLCLYTNLNLSSGDEDLASSNADGWVVVVSSEAGAPKI